MLFFLCLRTEIFLVVEPQFGGKIYSMTFVDQLELTDGNMMEVAPIASKHPLLTPQSPE